jgi:hypothetical protein
LEQHLAIPVAVVRISGHYGRCLTQQLQEGPSYSTAFPAGLQAMMPIHNQPLLFLGIYILGHSALIRALDHRGCGCGGHRQSTAKRS